MHIDCEHQGETLVMKLEGELSVVNVGQAHRQVVSEMADSQDVLLDLAGLEDSDTAGIQLLLSVATSARISNRGLVVTGINHGLQDALMRVSVDLADQCMS